MKTQNKLQILINLFGRFSLIGIVSTVIYFILANLLILIPRARCERFHLRGPGRALLAARSFIVVLQFEG